MSFIVEIIRVENPDSPTNLEPLSSSSTQPLEVALYGFAKALQVHVDASTPPGYSSSAPLLARNLALGEHLKNAFLAETGKSSNTWAPLDASGTRAVIFGPDEWSIYDPDQDVWTIVKEGKGYVLGLRVTSPEDEVQKTKFRYDIQIRPRDDADVDTLSECTYSVPAEALGFLSDADRDSAINTMATSLVLYFTHTRSAIERVVSLHPAATATTRDDIGQFDDKSNIWFVQGPLLHEQATSSVKVRVRFRGDPPDLRAATFYYGDLQRGGDEKEVDHDEHCCCACCRCACGPCPPLPVPPSVLPRTALKSAMKYGVSWTDELLHRRCLIRHEYGDDPHRLFFYELDRDSAPNSGNLKYASLGALCAVRYLRRASEVHRGASGVLLPSIPELRRYQSVIIDAGDLIVGLLEKYFPGDEDFSDAKARQLFEAFAKGRLGVFATHGAPNGLNYFCFVEIALLSIAVGRLVGNRTRVEKWQRLLNILVLTAELYVRCYHQIGGRYTMCAFRVEYNRLGLRAPDEAQYVELVSRWSTTAKEQLYAQVVYSSMNDEYDASGPLPLHVPDYTAPDLI